MVSGYVCMKNNIGVDFANIMLIVHLYHLFSDLNLSVNFCEKVSCLGRIKNQGPKSSKQIIIVYV